MGEEILIMFPQSCLVISKQWCAEVLPVCVCFKSGRCWLVAMRTLTIVVDSWLSGQLAEFPGIALSSCLFPTTSHISFSIMYQETWEVQRSRGISQDLVGLPLPVASATESGIKSQDRQWFEYQLSIFPTGSLSS